MLRDRVGEEDCYHKEMKWLKGNMYHLKRAEAMNSAVLNQGQSMDMDRFPSLSEARKKHKKQGHKAAVICKLSQHTAQGRRTRTTGI